MQIRTWGTAVVLGLWAGSAALAADVGPLKGGWVQEGLACSLLETQGEPNFIKITNNRFDFWNYPCKIQSLSRKKSRFTVDLVCEGEGQTTPFTWQGTLRGRNRLSDKDGMRYVRCY